MASSSYFSSGTSDLKTQGPATISCSDPNYDQPSQLPSAYAAPDQPSSSTDAGAAAGEGNEDDNEEAVEGECGFCLFMKGGGCKDSFVAWEKCMEDAEKSGEDVVEKCAEVTALLKKCMDAHADYYEPILKAERAMADSIASEAANGDSDSTTSASAAATTCTAPDDTALEKEEKRGSS